MNKSSLFIAAGAAAILCGCSTPVASNKPVIPAPPVDDPAPVAVTEPAVQPAETQVKQRPVQAPAFEPLTDAISSGGVDSAPRKGKKAIKNSSIAVLNIFLIFKVITNIIFGDFIDFITNNIYLLFLDNLLLWNILVLLDNHFLL